MASNTMADEKLLNDILERMYTIINFKQLNELKQNQLVDLKIDDTKLRNLLKRLEEDKYVSHLRDGYQIKESGKRFFDDGGYIKALENKIAKEKRENEAHELLKAIKNKNEAMNSNLNIAGNMENSNINIGGDFVSQSSSSRSGDKQVAPIIPAKRTIISRLFSSISKNIRDIIIKVIAGLIVALIAYYCLRK